MDLDSGPIVLGVGLAATGLGLGAARMFHDGALYTVIRRAELVFGVPTPWPSGGLLTAPLLGEAILFDGRAARPWFDGVDAVPPQGVAAPIVPVVFTLLDVAVLASIALAMRRS